jgi:hypothetical protein
VASSTPAAADSHTATAGVGGPGSAPFTLAADRPDRGRLLQPVVQQQAQRVLLELVHALQILLRNAHHGEEGRAFLLRPLGVEPDGRQVVLRASDVAPQDVVGVLLLRLQVEACIRQVRRLLLLGVELRLRLLGAEPLDAGTVGRI